MPWNSGKPIKPARDSVLIMNKIQAQNANLQEAHFSNMSSYSEKKIKSKASLYSYFNITAPWQ